MVDNICFNCDYDLNDVNYHQFSPISVCLVCGGELNRYKRVHTGVQTWCIRLCVDCGYEVIEECKILKKGG